MGCIGGYAWRYMRATQILGETFIVLWFTLASLETLEQSISKALNSNDQVRLCFFEECHVCTETFVVEQELLVVLVHLEDFGFQCLKKGLEEDLGLFEVKMVWVPVFAEFGREDNSSIWKWVRGLNG